MKNGDRYYTGQEAPAGGSFVFDGYYDGRSRPSPTQEERVISLSRGQRFPPIRSQNAAAWWKCQRVH